MSKDMLRFNPDEVEGDDSPRNIVLPEANSDVVAVIRKDATELRTSKTSGNQYLNVKLEVLTGAGKGYWLFYSVPSGQYQSTFLGRLLTGCGVDTRTARDVAVSELAGMRCRVHIKHVVSGGKTKAEIQYFLKYDASVKTIADNTAQVTPNAAPKASRPATPAAQETDDDNLPF